MKAREKINGETEMREMKRDLPVQEKKQYRNKIPCSSIEQMIEVAHECVKKGLTFEASAVDMTVTLTGGF